MDKLYVVTRSSRVVTVPIAHEEAVRYVEEHCKKEKEVMKILIKESN